MRWTTFTITTFIALVLELGLRTLWVVYLGGVGAGPVSPSLLLILAVFVWLWASRPAALWAAVVLGVLVDLQPMAIVGARADAAVIGPSSLGFLTACAITLQMRSVMFRTSPLTMGLLVAVAGLFAHLITVSILTVRGLPVLTYGPISDWSASSQIYTRFFELLYTAIVAVPSGWLLMRTRAWWNFPSINTGRQRRTV